MVACQVFGARAGKNAALYALKKMGEKSAEPTRVLASAVELTEGMAKEAERIGSILRKSAQDKILISRSEEGLAGMKADIRQFREELKKFPLPGSNRKIWELHSLLTTGEIITESALARRESRGSHFRRDFPERSDRHEHVLILKKRVLRSAFIRTGIDTGSEPDRIRFDKNIFIV